ncbi:MAG: hypothetical protein M3445_10115 [Actinomycetota bacterium]|nr:hypothetical protein [Actinomycetota bacterium]
MTQPSSDPLRQSSTPRDADQWPCRSICVWAVTGEVWYDGTGRPGLRVFACRGCRSEWVRTEPWTPMDKSGQVPAAVAAERARDS